MVDLMAINEGLLAVSIERLGEEVSFISVDTGKLHAVKGQVRRDYVSAGEDSRGITQGSRQVMKVAEASVTVRESTVRAFSTNLSGWAVRIRVNPASTELQTMYAEESPEGRTSMGLITLRLTAAKRFTP